MRLGIGSPGYLGTAVEPNDVLQWARAADEAGFDGLAVHDRPAHDTWEPLAALAAFAPITRRVRLITTALILPARDEALVAKQACLVDQLSGGRLELGVGLGGRPDDYEALGAPFSRRGRRFEQQLRRLGELFAAAIEHPDDGSTPGPPPLQRPRPPIRVGGYQPAAIRRAVELGDGYIFGAPGVELMRERVPAIRRAYAHAGRADLPIGGLAYIAATSDPGRLARAETMLRHYYGTLRRPFHEMVLHGDEPALRLGIGAYEAAGLDVLYLFPVLPELDQVEAIARLLP